MGLLVALDRFDGEPGEDNDRILTALHAGLAAFTATEIVPDRAGRPISRVGLRQPPLLAKRLVQHLAAGEPSIRTRNHQLASGLVLFDVRELRPDDVPTIVARVREFLTTAGTAGH